MRQALAPLSAAVCIPVAVAVALVAGADWAPAAAGAALGLLYSLLELAATLLGSRGSFNRALAAGLGGMAVRMIVVLGALAAIGLTTTRQQTLVAILAFVGTFTVAFAVHMSVLPSLDGGGPTAPRRGGGSSDTGGDAPPRTRRSVRT